MDTCFVGKEDYSVFLRLARLAETTKRTYSHYIDEFQLWADERHLVLAEISACQVLDWADSHQWASSTRYGAVTAVRSFFAWRFGKQHDVSLFARVRRLESVTLAAPC